MTVVTSMQEFYHYCPPDARRDRGKRALPEAECLTPAAKRARLAYLATTKDANKAPPPQEERVR